MRRWGLLCTIGLMCVGCGDKLAQSVTSQTLKSVVEYETALDAKIAAERAFYVNSARPFNIACSATRP